MTAARPGRREFLFLCLCVATGRLSCATRIRGRSVPGQIIANRSYDTQPATKNLTALLAQRAEVATRVRALFCDPKTPCYKHFSDKEAFLQYHPGQKEEHATCFDGDGASRPAKLTLLSLHVGLPPKYTNGLRLNRLKEADRFGYEYCEYTHRLNNEREIAWSKVTAIMVLMEHGRKQVAWMDADALIMNPQPFEHITAPYFSKGKAAVFTNDFDEGGRETTPRSSINSGVFVIRNEPWTLSFLNSIWKDYPQALRHPWWEQKAILLYRDDHLEDFTRHAAIIKHRIMNSWAFNDYQKGDFILHAAGGHNKHKYENLEKQFMHGA